MNWKLCNGNEYTTGRYTVSRTIVEGVKSSAVVPRATIVSFFGGLGCMLQLKDEHDHDRGNAGYIILPKSVG